MSSAIAPKDSKLRQLDRPGEPDEQFTEEHAKDGERLSRVIVRLLRDVASLKRRFAPRRVDFEDVAVDSSGTVVHKFVHRLGGRVRYWAVDWQPAGSGAPTLGRHSSTDENTLALVSFNVGTVTIRIEEAG